MIYAGEQSWTFLNHSSKYLTGQVGSLFVCYWKSSTVNGFTSGWIRFCKVV